MTTGDEAQEGRRLLRIYLQDHLAASAAGHELAKRCQGNNRGTPLGDELADIARQIGEDRATLAKLARGLDFPENPVKNVAALVAERVGRLKLNGGLGGYSDLSRVLELEGLTAGISAKRSLWQSLVHLVEDEPAIREVPLDDLIGRAEDQLRRLESHRLEAARRAFA